MQVKKDYIQDGIISAATEEFSQNGYTGSSMRKIAEKANTKMSNVYNYFKSKEDLYSYIVSAQYVQIQTILKKALLEYDRLDFKTMRDTKWLYQDSKRWLMRFDSLITEKTYILLTAVDSEPFSTAKDELVGVVVQIMEKLCGKSQKSISETYPLNTFVEQLFDDLLITTKKFKKTTADKKKIVFNQIHTAFLGYIIMLINSQN